MFSRSSSSPASLTWIQHKQHLIIKADIDEDIHAYTTRAQCQQTAYMMVCLVLILVEKCLRV